MFIVNSWLTELTFSSFLFIYLFCVISHIQEAPKYSTIGKGLFKAVLKMQFA